MRQRVMIAMAIANDPDVLIADEPTTALDVTIQAQVLEVLETAREITDAATIMITHDLGVVAGIADRIVVMYAGKAVESGPVEPVYADPRMPYTIGLLGSVPRLDRPGQPLTPIEGSPPNVASLPPGLPVRRRAARSASPICATVEPALEADRRWRPQRRLPPQRGDRARPDPRRAGLPAAGDRHGPRGGAPRAAARRCSRCATSSSATR